MQESNTIYDQLQKLLNGKTETEQLDMIFRIWNNHIEIWDSTDPIYQAFVNQKIKWGPSQPPLQDWYGTTYNIPETTLFGLQRIGLLCNEDGRRYEICKLVR